MPNDAQNLFSENQEVLATTVSENIIDTGTTKDGSKGNPVKIYGRVTVPYDSLTSFTLIIQASVDEAFTAPINLGYIILTGADVDTAGNLLIDMYLPRKAARYLRLSYTLAGSPTTGSVTAGVVFNSFSNEEGV